MLSGARAMLSPVRLSATPVDKSKTVEVRIMIFSPHGSPVPLVLRGKFHVTGPLRAGASNKGGMEKTSHTLALNVNISKTVGYTTTVTIDD